MTHTCRFRIVQNAMVACLVTALGACAIAPPRTDDPLQKFNRPMFAFNQVVDKVALRPAAKAYVKVTGPKERELLGNFFANLRSPVTITNSMLQGRPGPALETTGRFMINSTVGFLGFFDPASAMQLPARTTDFGVTLAHWGVPEGPYLVLPFIGPTTLRDVWKLPVDSYLDPFGWYARGNSFRWYAQYTPSAVYLLTLRARALPLDNAFDAAYDPYAFLRDAYRQHRLFVIYHGDPPLSAMEELQGTSAGEGNSENIDQLLQQQQAYETARGLNDSGIPAHAGASAPPAAKGNMPTRKAASPTRIALPAPATSVALPAAASSAPQPPSASFYR